MQINVVIAEDEKVIRSSIVHRIEACDPDFRIIAQADDGEEALAAIDRYQPQVLITDLKMPHMDGIALIQRVQRRYPQVQLVILTSYSDFSYMQEAIRCGVSSYLLKPLEEEALGDVLRALKSKLVQQQHFRTPAIIRSSNFEEQPRSPMEEALFAICLGNLVCETAAPSAPALPALPWDTVFCGLMPRVEDWSLIQENSGELTLSLRSWDFSGVDLEAGAENLQQRLQDYLPGLPIQVAASQKAQQADTVWTCRQRLLNLLHSRCVPARSSLLILERDELTRPSHGLDIVKMRINEDLCPYMEAKNMAAIQEELEMLFRYMTDHGISQRDMEKVISHIVRLQDFSGALENSSQVLTGVLEQLYQCTNAEALPETMVQTLMVTLWPKERPKPLWEQLQDYVDQHFLQLEQLENLTQVFHYNYTYLSRLFKKQVGISLNQYVQNKRIDVAKELIATKESLNVAQIAALSGFSDRRNFLRAFKAHTGLSPKDYQAKIRVR